YCRHSSRYLSKGFRSDWTGNKRFHHQIDVQMAMNRYHEPCFPNWYHKDGYPIAHLQDHKFHGYVHLKLLLVIRLSDLAGTTFHLDNAQILHWQYLHPRTGRYKRSYSSDAQ